MPEQDLLGHLDLLGRLENIDEAFWCSQCSKEVKIMNPENSVMLSESGPHIKITCITCGRFIKFARQKLPPEERARIERMQSAQPNLEA